MRGRPHLGGDEVEADLAEHDQRDERHRSPACRDRQRQDHLGQRHRDHHPGARQRTHCLGEVGQTVAAQLEERPDRPLVEAPQRGVQQWPGDHQHDHREDGEHRRPGEHEPAHRRAAVRKDRLGGRREVQGRALLLLQTLRQWRGAASQVVLPAAEGGGGGGQPAGAQRPAGEDIGDEVHAEGQPADADRDHEHRGGGDEPAAPATAYGGKCDQHQHPPGDQRGHGVPAGEAGVARKLDHRQRDVRAGPADEHLRDGHQDRQTEAGGDDVGGEPALSPDQQPDGGEHQHVHRCPVAAAVGDDPQHLDRDRRGGDDLVEPGRDVAVERLQW